MSQSSAPPGTFDASLESSIRQLIGNGRTKTALDRAKDAHKQFNRPESEALLLAAYDARIRDLASQGLSREAAMLWDTVQQRFPAAAARLGNPLEPARPQDTMAALLAPLAAPDATAETIAAVEKKIAAEVTDLEAVASCEALPAGHPLRLAAGALHAAFTAVTSGPVDADALRLNEVSRRSPLASWKPLILAIHHFHRNDDAACRQYLAAIPETSAPHRLAAALTSMLAGTAPLATPKCKALAAAISPDQSTLRRVLEALDKVMRGSPDDGRVLKQVRVAVEECRRKRPDLLRRLMQHISVECSLFDIPVDQVRAAMGGAAARDAYFFRLLARAWEGGPGPDAMARSAHAWAEFRTHAIAEGWFPERGPENAALYMHMADNLRLAEMDTPHLFGPRTDVPWYVDVAELFERACVQDPQPEYFSIWLAWAQTVQPRGAESVAALWSRLCPQDVRPLLLLMDEFEARNALAKAMQCLEKAEAVDSVHPAVRAARLRILLKTALRHIQKRQDHLTAKDLAQMEELAQVRQGDRAAIPPALRYLTSLHSRDGKTDDASRAEVERILGGPVPAALVLSALGNIAKRPVYLPDTQGIPADQMAAMPQILARSGALLDDCAIRAIPPRNWLEAAVRALRKEKPALTAAQLATLGSLALNAQRQEAAYVFSAEGLKLGAASEARFLLLRARAIPEWQWHRRNRCAAAALKLAAQIRDQETVEAVHRALISGPLEIDAELMEMVRACERKANTFPTHNDPGPDYREHDEEFQLAEAEAEAMDFDPFDDEDDDDFDFDGDFDKTSAPPMPKELKDLFFEAVKVAIRNGQSPEQFEREMAKRLDSGAGSKRKKRR